MVVRALLEWNEAGRMGGTNTWLTVLDRLVCDGELSQIMSDHFWLDFNLVECLAIVNTDIGVRHFRDNDHVSQVSLDDSRLLFNDALNGFLGLA